MISGAVTMAGCQVVHLLDVRRREPHRLNPLRVEGFQIVYDVGAQLTLGP
jgi:hypothetical protein